MKKAVILLSGGLDSATTLAIARSEGYEPYVLSFRYGQRHHYELEAARKVAAAMAVSRHIMVEIDLRRGGEHMATREQFPPCDYMVHVSRRGKRPRGLVWPIFLTQRLPVIPIPLKEGDPDVSLDLQEILSTAYERGAYDLVVDYKGDCNPPLSGDAAQWAAGFLHR